MKKYISIFILLFTLLFSANLTALGECGLSCCVAGTSTSGVTLAENIGISIQYEYMDMETIRHGTDSVSPEEVLNRLWPSNGKYSIPTQMTMEKLSLIAVKPINERWQVLGIIPYIRNNMDMRMRNPMGMDMDMSMEEISGLGDISILGLYTAYTDAPIRAKQRLTLGFGVKTATGKNDTRTSNGHYVHAMMQAGSGSWDPLLMLNYMRAWYPLVMQVNMLYHLTTEGDEGYEFGNQFGLDLISRYQISNYTNLGLELNAIYAAKDKDHEGKYSRPTLSMPDNTENTGLTSVFLSPALQFKIPNTGGSFELKYQHPLRQDVNGYQQVVDARWLVSLSWAW